MSINVKQCLVSPTTNPKFTADIGDTVLIKNDQGHLEEVEIISIRGDQVGCTDSTGSHLDIQANRVLAVCI